MYSSIYSLIHNKTHALNFTANFTPSFGWVRSLHPKEGNPSWLPMPRIRREEVQFLLELSGSRLAAASASAAEKAEGASQIFR